ncbi:hypothetical protein B9Z19DRAFT_1078931 [Tuber borchii]|uniref:Uncharacterized protein n=1 Tax=Tuber borchii TaxID=42251 RepID=A0A2T6ZYW3_TUBBO|nr:hypothetical protein B9Z19DRAFT_1078931 [Tuber borchii]
MRLLYCFLYLSLTYCFLGLSSPIHFASPFRFIYCTRKVSLYMLILLLPSFLPPLASSVIRSFLLFSLLLRGSRYLCFSFKTYISVVFDLLLISSSSYAFSGKVSSVLLLH